MKLFEDSKRMADGSDKKLIIGTNEGKERLTPKGNEERRQKKERKGAKAEAKAEAKAKAKAKAKPDSDGDILPLS